MYNKENNKDKSKVTSEGFSIPTEFSAAMHAKCPRCRRGDMFENAMYDFSSQKMHVACPHCKMRFEKEPGYWYVSMFVSYALNVAEMVTLAVITYLITGNLENPYLYMAVLFVGILLLAPFNFRYSRVILLYWLTPGLKFNPDKSSDKGDRIEE